MSSRPWYKRYPSDFISGTLHLTLEQKGAYSMVLDLIYDRGGPIPDDPQWIARVCGCSTRKWNKLRADLISMGHLQAEDGMLSNERAINGVLSGDKEHRKLSESGAKGAEKTNEKKARTRKNNNLAEKGPGKTGRHTRNQKLDKGANAPLSALAQAVDDWNLFAAEMGLSQVQKMTDARKAALRARLKDAGGIEGWRAAIEKIRGIPWMWDGSGRGGWTANFDFLLQESSFTKLMEGAYDTKTGGGNPTAAAVQRLKEEAWAN